MTLINWLLKSKCMINIFWIFLCCMKIQYEIIFYFLFYFWETWPYAWKQKHFFNVLTKTEYFNTEFVSLQYKNTNRYWSKCSKKYTRKSQKKIKNIYLEFFFRLGPARPMWLGWTQLVSTCKRAWTIHARLLQSRCNQSSSAQYLCIICEVGEVYLEATKATTCLGPLSSPFRLFFFSSGSSFFFCFCLPSLSFSSSLFPGAAGGEAGAWWRRRWLAMLLSVCFFFSSVLPSLLFYSILFPSLSVSSFFFLWFPPCSALLSSPLCFLPSPAPAPPSLSLPLTFPSPSVFFSFLCRSRLSALASWWCSCSRWFTVAASPLQTKMTVWKGCSTNTASSPLVFSSVFSLLSRSSSSFSFSSLSPLLFPFSLFSPPHSYDPSSAFIAKGCRRFPATK